MKANAEGDADELGSLQVQMSQGISFANSLGESYEVYKEQKSGKNIDRQDYLRLMKDISTGQVKALWVKKVDRSSRDFTDGVSLLQALQLHKVRLFEGCQNNSEIDLTDASAVAMTQIKYVFAELERKTIEQRTDEFLKKMIDAGRRKFCYVYGYQYEYRADGKKYPIIQEVEAEVVKLIYKMYEDGKSFTDITRFLNESTNYKPKKTGWKYKSGPKKGQVQTPKFDANTISKILHRPEYIGKTKDTKGNLIPSIYPAIIIDELAWFRIQESIDQNTLLRVRKHIHVAQNLVSGLVRCPRCGAGYFFHKTTMRHGKDVEYNTYMHKAFTETQRACENSPKNLVAHYLDSLVIHIYETLILNRADFLKFAQRQKSEILLTIAKLNEQAEEIEKELEAVKQEQNRLIAAIIKGSIDEEDAVVWKVKLKKQASMLSDKALSMRSEARMLTTNEHAAFRILQEEEMLSFNKLSVKQQRELLGARLHLELEAGVLTITSLIGSKFCLDVSKFKAKCDHVEKTLADNPKLFYGKNVAPNDQAYQKNRHRLWVLKYIQLYGRKITYL